MDYRPSRRRAGNSFTSWWQGWWGGECCLKLVLRRGAAGLGLALAFAGWLRLNGFQLQAQELYEAALQEGAEGGFRFSALCGLASLATSRGDLDTGAAYWGACAKGLQGFFPDGIPHKAVAVMLGEKEGGMITLGNGLLHSGSREQAEAVFTLVFLMFAAQRAWIVQTFESVRSLQQEREEEAAELALALALSNE